MFFIQTERLILRNFRKEDAGGLFELLSKPRANCYADEKIYTMFEAEKLIKEKQQISDESDVAVCMADTGRFIGNLFSQKEEPDTYTICCNFLADIGNRGYAYEGASAYLDYLFNMKNARRIYAYVEDDNLNSQRLYKRLGMRQEGLFREFISFVNNPDGTPKYENTMEFAILKKDWLR